MTGARRCLAAVIAVAVGVSLMLGSSGPERANARSPTSNGTMGPIGPTATTEPIDESGITFTAFRSSGLPIVPGESFWLAVQAWVPAPAPYYAEVVNGEEVFIGQTTWQLGGTVNGVTSRHADWLIEEPTEGIHTYLAVFPATDQFDELRLSLEVVVAPATMTITVATPVNPVQTNHQILLYPEMEGGGTGSAMTGEFEWRNADSGALLATRPADDYFLTYGSLPVGEYHFTVRYTGDPHRAAVTSPIFTLTVTPDTIEASGVGVQYATFYPIVDGYRDTVGIKGTRLEPASVGIRVFSPAGSTVRIASLPTAAGAYSYPWNGRDAAGALLPAGRYRIVQTLTDGFGTKSSVTSYVTLSHGKLVTKTAYVTRDGPAVAAQGSGGGGAVTLSTAGGFAKLVAGSGWASVGWEFAIPGAVVYKSVAIEVYAKAGFSAPPTQLGIQNFQTCPRTSDWNASCFDRWVAVGDAAVSQRWYATSGSSSAAYRAGQFVRGLLMVDFGTVYVYEARAKVVYQVLEGGVTVGRAVVRR